MGTRKEGKPGVPLAWICVYGAVGMALVAAGVWLANDLAASRASIVAERTALALQTSRFMSQWFGTTIMNADYVLRDLTTKATPAELETAGRDAAAAKKLSALVSLKLATLPGVMGLGLLDKRRVFVGAADERLLGIQSNSKLRDDSGRALEEKAFVEYVPAAKSANKQPSILVSRPMLSAEGDFLGGALAAISLSSAQVWIESLSIDPKDRVAMLDGDGILLAIAPPRPDLIGKEMKYPSGAPGFGEGRASASFLAASPEDGRRRIYGLSKVENIPLNIVVGYDLERTLREWRQRAWQLAIGAVLLTILFGAAVYKHLQTLSQREQMRKMAVTDPLTGVANRRQLTIFAEHEIAMAIRYGRESSLLMIDIDHFKAINDAWGHATGDRVIKSLANTLAGNIRGTDAVGRFGGEEFVVVLAGTGPDGALVLAGRIRESVEKARLAESDDGAPVAFTVSIGVAGLGEGARTFEAILGLADKALYEAKHRGRNRVVLA